MGVTPIALPRQSALHEKITPGDFVDCYFNNNVSKQVSISEATLLVLANMPKWVDALMKLRNFAVSLCGLKTGSGAPASPIGKTDLMIDDRIGVFRVQRVTDNEIFVGEDDKHLNFLISVLRHKNGIALSTWVHTHNNFGKAYLWTIMPFHKLIVRDAAQRFSQL